MRKILMIALPASALAGFGLYRAHAAAQRTQPAAERTAIQLPAGAVVRVRTSQALDTARNRPGDRFAAALAESISLSGGALLPKGTRFTGRVVEAKPSGRLKGRAVLQLTLESFTFQGKTYPVKTNAPAWHSQPHRNRNLAWIGGGAGSGAFLAGLAAGGPWTLLGAGAGAGAGLATAAVTGRKQASLPPESVVSFTLRAPVPVQASRAGGDRS